MPYPTYEYDRGRSGHPGPSAQQQIGYNTYLLDQAQQKERAAQWSAPIQSSGGGGGGADIGYGFALLVTFSCLALLVLNYYMPLPENRKIEHALVAMGMDREWAGIVDLICPFVIAYWIAKKLADRFEVAIRRLVGFAVLGFFAYAYLQSR